MVKIVQNKKMHNPRTIWYRGYFYYGLVDVQYTHRVRNIFFCISLVSLLNWRIKHYLEGIKRQYKITFLKDVSLMIS